MTQTMTQPVTQPVQVIQRTPIIQMMEAPAQKRVAAYCRVSTDLEEQQSSLDTQITTFREQICRRPDWKLAGIYADEGVTGTSVLKRTEFQRMIADCEAGKVDYIITKSISRFARNTLECLSYVRRLKELGVYILFVKENIDTATSTSEVVLSVLAAIAQEESHSISENLKWSNRKRFAAGTEKWSATYRPDKHEPYTSHYLENTHEGIIDRETWERAKALLDKRRSEMTKGVHHNSNGHFLYGKLFCGDCGAPYKRRSLTNRDGTSYKAWNCKERQKGRSGNGCKNIVLKEDALLADISAQLGWEWVDADRFDTSLFLHAVDRIQISADGIAVCKPMAV